MLKSRSKSSVPMKGISMTPFPFFPPPRMTTRVARCSWSAASSAFTTGSAERPAEDLEEDREPDPPSRVFRSTSRTDQPPFTACRATSATRTGSFSDRRARA